VARIDPLTAHMNARVRGMKAELLSHQQLDAFLDQGDVNQMAQALLDSAYKTEMAEALAEASGADAIEIAVSRNLVTTYRKLMRCAQGRLRAPAELFLTRWDLMPPSSRFCATGITGSMRTPLWTP
jgi:vacuolar-type H+-ATPase subunit C/Vma6